ncbi:MAG: rhomboid family intramembrane serine protease [Candidatus Latescibacterota bacterium]|nr:MAG: rhomboid family intramembrane serine protease [Candidatus Latescibacterota bacterium]
MFYFFYYVPVGINAPLRRTPFLTYTYTGLCVLVFVLNRFFAGYIPFDFYRLIYSPFDGSLVTAVTAAFLHFGYVHLIGNLVYLLLIGRYVEDRLGPVLFSIVFLVSAGLGNVLQGVFNTHVLNDPYVGIVGASGAVSGLLGAAAVRFFYSKLRIAYWVFLPLQAYTRAGRSEMPVVFAIALWFVLQVARGSIQVGGFGTQVAYVTHIAGFLLGAGLAAVTGQYTEGRVDAMLRRAAKYMTKGQGYAAQGEYIRYVAHRPDDADAHAALARAMILTKDHHGARKYYRRACELLLGQMRRGDCETVYQEALRGFEDFTLSPEHHIKLAFGLERNLKPKLAVTAYETFARRYPKHSESPLALLRAAGLYLQTFTDTRRADECYRRLIEDYPDDVWVDFAREQRRQLGSC